MDFADDEVVYSSESVTSSNETFSSDAVCYFPSSTSTTTSTTSTDNSSVSALSAADAIISPSNTVTATASDLTSSGETGDESHVNRVSMEQLSQLAHYLATYKAEVVFCTEGDNDHDGNLEELCVHRRGEENPLLEGDLDTGTVNGQSARMYDTSFAYLTAENSWHRINNQFTTLAHATDSFHSYAIINGDHYIDGTVGSPVALAHLTIIVTGDLYINADLNIVAGENMNGLALVVGGALHVNAPVTVSGVIIAERLVSSAQMDINGRLILAGDGDNVINADINITTEGGYMAIQYGNASIPQQSLFTVSR